MGVKGLALDDDVDVRVRIRAPQLHERRRVRLAAGENDDLIGARRRRETAGPHGTARNGQRAAAVVARPLRRRLTHRHARRRHCRVRRLLVRQRRRRRLLVWLRLLVHKRGGLILPLVIIARVLGAQRALGLLPQLLRRRRLVLLPTIAAPVGGCACPWRRPPTRRLRGEFALRQPLPLVIVVCVGAAWRGELRTERSPRAGHAQSCGRPRG